MRQVIRCVWEHHGEDSLPHAIDYAGSVYAGAEQGLRRGEDGGRNCLLLGMEPWGSPRCMDRGSGAGKVSDLRIADADSDVLFEEEKAPLSEEEYRQRKALVLKSAEDFWGLYQSVPNPDASCLPSRTTFYGPVPRTAREMYQHTKM